MLVCVCMGELVVPGTNGRPDPREVVNDLWCSLLQVEDESPEAVLQQSKCKHACKVDLQQKQQDKYTTSKQQEKT